jgi:DNA primase large subunit
MNREALRLIKTADKGRLEKAKENFLTLTDIISVESVMQYADTIKLASITEDYRSQVMKELKSVVNEYLGEMQLENIIQMATGQKNTEPSAIGKSSGSSQKMTPKKGKKS